MRDTEHASAEASFQERQVVAGRYRLVACQRKDETTEVWRAFDEAGHHVVTLDLLRDLRPESRERFVTEARRIAMQRPTAMRVAGIHDEADGTFIIYEDVVRESVALDAPKPAVEERVEIRKKPERATTQPPIFGRPTIEPVAAMAAQPTRASAADPFAPDAPSPDLSGDSSDDHGLAGLITVLRLRDPGLIEMRLFVESASEIAAAARSRLEDLHLEDVRVDAVVAEARALLERIVAEARALLDRVDLTRLSSVFERSVVALRRLASIRPHLRVPTLPHMSLPHMSLPRMSLPAPRLSRSSRVRTPHVKTVVRPAPAPRAPRFAGRPVVHVRWGRVISRGLSLGLLAVVLVTVPSELAADLAANLESELSSKVGQALQPAPSAPELSGATFELPPLSAYGAAFESQGPYPTARPNGTVEWIVALRNTGSAGWYRGIDGAQASLALADGNNAAVQSTPYVGPGQVGWFVVRVRASAQPGAYNLVLTPRIDGRGPLPDLGIYATVTVSTAGP